MSKEQRDLLFLIYDLIKINYFLLYIAFIKWYFVIKRKCHLKPDAIAKMENAK